MTRAERKAGPQSRRGAVTLLVSQIELFSSHVQYSYSYRLLRPIIQEFLQYFIELPLEVIISLEGVQVRGSR